MDKLEMTHVEKVGVELRGWLHICEELGCNPAELVGSVKSAELQLALSLLLPKTQMTVDQAKERAYLGLMDCIERLTEEAKLL